jgi:hypothetical protein
MKKAGYPTGKCGGRLRGRWSVTTHRRADTAGRRSRLEELGFKVNLQRRPTM